MTAADTISRLAAGLLAEQKAVLLDESLLKTVFCTRRSGKSFGLGAYLFIAALQHAGSSSLYLGLTKASATNTMNKDIFRIINKQYKLGAQWRESKLRWELPNGSYIYLRGADANAYEIEKIVGQKYRVAVLDEASKYRYDLRKIVYGSLLPAMGDDLGTIVMAGTPSNNTRTLFYDATTQREPGWSNHHWTWRANSYRSENISKMLKDRLEANPALSMTPLWRQEWDGEWVVDLSALVYKFDDARNTIAVLPEAKTAYTFVLGVDTGFQDATAFVVVAYSEYDPALYVVEATKQSGLIYSAVAQQILMLQKRYPISKIVVDAPLQGAEEMRQRFGLPLEATDKAGKKSVIDLMNSDLLTSRVRLLPAAMALTEEWGSLIWDDRELAKIPSRFVEHAGFDNHLADAALYAWRASRNYTATKAPEPPAMVGTPEWEQDWLEQQYVLARRSKMEQQDPLLRAMPAQSPAMRWSTR